jgi:hypothetical protein
MKLLHQSLLGSAKFFLAASAVALSASPAQAKPVHQATIAIFVQSTVNGAQRASTAVAFRKGTEETLTFDLGSASSPLIRNMSPSRLRWVRKDYFTSYQPQSNIMIYYAGQSTPIANIRIYLVDEVMDKVVQEGTAPTDLFATADRVERCLAGLKNGSYDYFYAAFNDRYTGKGLRPFWLECGDTTPYTP